MEHLSNRNRIGTFQKLNDRKYHFLRKKWEIIHFWKVKKDFKFRKTKNFRKNHNQKLVIRIFFSKFLFPRILKILLHLKFEFLSYFTQKIHEKLLKSAHRTFWVRVIELRHGWTSAQELRHKFRKISLTSAQINFGTSH